MNHPLVSVFIPYYNDEDYLKDAIDAILAQTYSNWELILFNHGSTDNSCKIAHSYKDKRIKHINSKVNLGAGSGYNLKISLSYMAGKYVKLLCADDTLKENALELLVETMEKHPDKDMIFANMDFVDENLNQLGQTWSSTIPMADSISSEKKALLNMFKGFSHLAYPSSMVKLEAIKSINLDKFFIMLFDVSLWVSLLLKGKKLIYLDKCVVNYRISSNQISSISKLKKSAKIGYFELSMLLNLYYSINDINLIKYLCPCKYSRMLEKGDERFIPFILSYFFASITLRRDFNYFKDQLDVREIFGTTRLYELLQDEKYMKFIEKKFKFGIKEFRQIYSSLPPDSESIAEFTFKHKIYKKCGKNLQIFQLIYLLSRKIINVVNPTYYKHKFLKNRNKNKRYTV